MSTQPAGYGVGGVRVTMMQRRPADPGKIEKAKNPRSAILRLLDYLKPFKLQLGLVLVLVLIYTLLGLAGPYLMGRANDQFISTRQVSGLAGISLLMLLIYLINNLFQAVANWVMANISQRALKLMRKDLFFLLQELPLNFYDHNPAGELMSRLTT